MELLKLFNQKLKNLPDISKSLQELIILQEWPEEKTRQAVEIVQQIDKCKPVVNEVLGYRFICMTQITITCCTTELGIDAEKFGPKNILKAVRYIDDLLSDINQISKEVQFSFGGYHYDEYDIDMNSCIFAISLEF